MKFREAHEVAWKFLREVWDAGANEIVITRIETYPEGWVFYYTSLEDVETGDHVYGLLDNDPVFVERATGKPHLMRVPMESTEAWLQAWREGKANPVE